MRTPKYNSITRAKVLTLIAEGRTVKDTCKLVGISDIITADSLKVRGRAVGAEHEQMLERTSGYMTAWLCYQLLDDENATKAFIGEDAELLSNKKWQDIKISE